MISFDDFLRKKRQTRTRGKLAGLHAQIERFRAAGASFSEIAEYLHLQFGITVSVSGLAKSMEGWNDRQPQPSPPPPAAPAPAPSTPSSAIEYEGPARRDRVVVSRRRTRRTSR